eukprot:jgi/Tetstr1/454976/TSEL_041836.t1
MPDPPPPGAGGSSDQWPALGQSFGPLSPASWGQVSFAAAQHAVQIQQAASAEQMSQLLALMRDIAHDAATAAVRAVLQAHGLPRLSLQHETAQPEPVPLPPAAPAQPEQLPMPPAAPAQPEPVPLPPPPPAQPGPVPAAAISAPAAFPLAAITCRSHLSARRYPFSRRHLASAIATDNAPLPREDHETYRCLGESGRAHKPSYAELCDASRVGRYPRRTRRCAAAVDSQRRLTSSRTTRRLWQQRARQAAPGADQQPRDAPPGQPEGGEHPLEPEASTPGAPGGLPRDNRFGLLALSATESRWTRWRICPLREMVDLEGMECNAIGERHAAEGQGHPVAEASQLGGAEQGLEAAEAAEEEPEESAAPKAWLCRARPERGAVRCSKAASC